MLLSPAEARGNDAFAKAGCAISGLCEARARAGTDGEQPGTDCYCATAPDARSRRNQCAAEAGRGGRAGGSPSGFAPDSQTRARGAALAKVARASKDLDPNPTDAGPALSGADPVQAR